MLLCNNQGITLLAFEPTEGSNPLSPLVHSYIVVLCISGSANMHVSVCLSAQPAVWL